MIHAFSFFFFFFFFFFLYSEEEKEDRPRQNKIFSYKIAEFFNSKIIRKYISLSICINKFLILTIKISLYLDRPIDYSSSSSTPKKNIKNLKNYFFLIN